MHYFISANYRQLIDSTKNCQLKTRERALKKSQHQAVIKKMKRQRLKAEKEIVKKP